MASPCNPNTPGGAPIDMHKIFRTSTPPPPATSIPTSNPNPQNFPNSNLTNPNLISSPFPPPSASYPPPTGGAAAGGMYSYQPQPAPFHYNLGYPAYSSPSPPHQEFANAHPQRSVSYPTPPLQPQAQSPTASDNFQNPPNSQNPNNHGARLMALLSAPPSTLEMLPQPTTAMPQIQPISSAGSDLPVPQNSSNLPSPGLVTSHQSPVLRMPSSKLPKGRHLVGDHVVYDIDVRLPGEVQPQLEVTPITKYVSDPGLVVGRQIAVNKTYICYGLKLGAIRVLNINTALRSLLKGLAQRVTDMAFFAEDVHLLASASVDGRVYVWKITEGPDEEDKPQITGKIVIAIQITGEGESEVLVVGIGKSVLRIDTTKVGKGEKFSAEEPLKCSIDKLIDGVQLVGSHDGEVTDLSMCQWMTTRLVSASVDGTGNMKKKRLVFALNARTGEPMDISRVSFWMACKRKGISRDDQLGIDRLNMAICLAYIWIKIWEDRKALPIAVLRPHDGLPVNSVTFLAAPDHPDHIILITGGPLNRELKIWVSASEEGWLLPSDAESWHSTQTLELKSSEGRSEEAFFNQVIALSQAGILLLANAKRNAIYAVHLEYGPNPAASRMDYIAEFTVTMPILSFTGTNELLPHGEQIVQVYCVQTQAIQQYALDLSQCLPPLMGNVVYEKSDSSVSRDASSVEGLANVEPSGSKQAEMSISSSAPKSSIHESGLETAPMRYPVSVASPVSSGPRELASSSIETKPVTSSEGADNTNISSLTSPSLPLSPRLSRSLSSLRSSSSSFEHGPSVNDRGAEPNVVEYSVDREMDAMRTNFSDVASLDDDSRNDDNKLDQDDSTTPNHRVKFKHPTHLVTPSEILMANSSSEVSHANEAKSVDGELSSQDVVISNDTRNVEVKVKVVGETGLNQNNDTGSQQKHQIFVPENKEKTFRSQASDLGIEMARECLALSPQIYIVEETRQFDGTGETEIIAPLATIEEVHDSGKDVSRKVLDSPTPVPPPQQPAPSAKGKKQKGKGGQVSGSSSPSPSAFNSTESYNEPGVSSSTTPIESAIPQTIAMQEMLNQLVTMQKEMQKQMATLVAAPVAKEGKRLEAALGRSMEKAVKANSDALWARFQEENTKQEKTAQERTQQLTNMISNCLNKDLPAIIERTVKRELTAVGQSVARTITPAIEKTVSTSIVESFQKGVGDKAVNQLEKSVNSKLEATVARQIQAQFQTSGKQALQETLKSSLEASVIPGFEMSCRAMFEQVDATFQKGMVEHKAAAQQQFEASHSPLALALREAINSASSVIQTLNSEILDGQRNLLALAAAGANSKAANPLVTQLSNGPLGSLHEKLEVPLDPTKELSRLVAERKYEEAFTTALQRSEVSIVSWLCSQVDLPGMLSMNPLPLSQGVLLSLLQQLACDISKETPRKLTWMREVLSAIDPTDPLIVVHPQPSPFHYHPGYPAYSSPSPPHQEYANAHPQRSLSYPTPPLQPQAQSPTSSDSSQNPSNHGARLMALLSAPPSTLEMLQQPAMPMPQIHPISSAGSDLPVSQNLNSFPSGPGIVSPHQSPVMRMPSSKLPKGRHLIGDHVVYDIDVRLPGEVQPQLEVTPITKYGSDPGLVVGRQIAVNKTYICYGLKLGAVRVLNINTALRSLLKGLAQRVTDMAFFAEDVHLLASASVDGRVYVWKITEGPDEEDKPQIAGRIIIAIQITGAGESVHPKVCWHCHKQEVLVVGIGKSVLKIDTTKVGRGEKFSAEEPLICSIDKLIDGVQLVGSHDGEVTDLSMCQWMTTRLVSASVDGTIKVWEDRKSAPIAVLRPHDGQPVNSVTFLAAPDRPDHIVLITGGPLNRELKIWVSASEEGWLLPSDAESWHCTQTLELKSSMGRLDEAFFNQVIALSQAGLILLANAKRNAIYAVHLEYGPNPAATRMDYIAEFTVTMPILSFTGTSELLPHGEQIVQVYCVQTQAIQQYALDLSQCLPPLMENVVYEKSESSSVSRYAASVEGLTDVEPSGSTQGNISISSSAPKASIHESGLESAPTVRYPVSVASAELPTSQEFASSSTETKLVPLREVANDTNISSVTSPSLPLSPKVSRTLSGFRSSSSSFEHGPSVNDRGSEPKTVEYSIDRQMDAIRSNSSDASFDDYNGDNKLSQDDLTALNHPIKFKHPTHLVTPSEILMANSSSEMSHANEPKISDAELNIQDVVMSNDARNVEVEVKVVGETRLGQNNDTGLQQKLQTLVSGNKEKAFCSQASDLGIEMARECHALSPETYIVEETRQFDRIGETEIIAAPSTVEEIRDSGNDVSKEVISSPAPMPGQQKQKGKKQKGKGAQGSGSSSPSPSAFNSTDSFNEPGISSGAPPTESAVPQFFAMQETLNQLVTMQKEMQKQMATMAAVPVTKEGKRLEAALGRSMEKAVKANADALWARIQEENTKQEKAARERIQQLTNIISNCLNKDLPAIIEKTFKRELTAVGQSVARTITPVIEKTISTSIVESFQKGVGDKSVNQLEKSVNSKLEATVARQIQAQFQTSGKQALQETLKSSLEASVIPAFEMSCRAMFEQVDATFQKGMVEHKAVAQQQFEASHSPLALALREAINSASSVTQTLNSEILDGQRKLLALASAGANSKAANPLVSQLSNGPLGGLHEIEVPLDPTKELARLIAERKYEEAFTTALQRSDVTTVSWLCSQVDLPGMLSMNPLPLSQGVLLSLLQQLACDISKETPRKLTWMREILSAINPTDSMIVVHVRPIFEQVYQILNHHRNLPTTTGPELSNIRLIMHIALASGSESVAYALWISMKSPPSTAGDDEVESMNRDVASGWYNLASVRYAVLISTGDAFRLTRRTS
ncbi:hypothetical protein BUALT_Bualt18G0078300 [Buddleja alternifolia]|uniref:Enhancer of mRNA-decapping protein 4 n=2 Tax=Magnoliopsida TaxID=3398 RepID=A0AAV6W9G7_9LAMI|nr:hypothetical protein BUALT_Bualt18G0078300 [Buddleja alternifolia]